MTTTAPRLQLSPSGPEVSRFVSGMMNLSQWQLSPRQRLDWLHACLDLGITTFDHADIYGSYTCEEQFGAALRLEPALRTRMEIVSKCGIKLLSANRPQHALKSYDTGREHIVASVNNSLQKLHTDYLDVLLIHRPDPLLDADAVAEAFGQLKQAGKVRFFGVSNFRPWHFDLLASRLDFPLVTNQVELSVLQMDVLHDGTLDQCQQHRLAPMIWSPFGGGRLFRGDDEQARRVRATLARIGDELGGAGPDQVALAWLLRHPSRPVPILGTGKLERLETAVQAAALTLSREQWFALWQASAGHEVP